MTIGILGGGISGLSLAYFLKENYEILEKSKSLGGLCKTYSKNGFLYDIGGHIMFSTNKDILQFEVELLGENVEKKRIIPIDFTRNDIWETNKIYLK